MARVLAVNQMQPSAAAVAQAVGVLSDGGVVVMPTDSVYGIGCAATPGNPAHERIFAIKRRKRSQTLPWLVADSAALDSFAVRLPSWAYDLSARYWPGALTLVVVASDAVGEDYRAANGTIALRVPASALVRSVAAVVGPLAVTSANVHGAAAALSGASIDPVIAGAVDLVLDAGPAPIGVASTIVDATGRVPRVLRAGAIPAADVQAAAV